MGLVEQMSLNVSPMSNSRWSNELDNNINAEQTRSKR